MDKSEGTELWISECNQFFDKCVELSGKGHHAEARKAMDLIFELLHQIDSSSDDIIFFADEGGSWQVGVNEEKVLPAYFRSLAAVAEPDEYAANVPSEAVNLAAMRFPLRYGCFFRRGVTSDPILFCPQRVGEYHSRAWSLSRPEVKG
jgi:hypothetical protein